MSIHFEYSVIRRKMQNVGRAGHAIQQRISCGLINSTCIPTLSFDHSLTLNGLSDSMISMIRIELGMIKGLVF